MDRKLRRISAAADREWQTANALCSMFWAINGCMVNRYTPANDYMLEMDDDYLRLTVRDVVRLVGNPYFQIGA